MPELSKFDHDYIKLTLEIEKHFPGYIDAYIGPPALQQEINASEKKNPLALLEDLEHIRARIPEENQDRAAYLKKSLRAIEGMLRILNGEPFDYLEEVNWLYDIQPKLVDEAVFTAAHNELDTLLLGNGGLAERLQARRERFEVPLEQVPPLLELARAETRQRTEKIIELVDGEDLELRLTSEQPWGAYNWYLGDSKSLIEFNTDVPISAIGILPTFAHEGYPGHHTEQQLKEKYLYRSMGYGEQAVLLINCPANVISEGIATTAVEVIFPPGAPDGDYHDWNENVMLAAAGIAVESADQMRRIAAAMHDLRYVSGNAAILYHTGELNRQETIDYFRTYALADQRRAERMLAFISNPLYRSYVFTYTAGYDLIADASNSGRLNLFRRLLKEQRLPSDLAAAVREHE